MNVTIEFRKGKWVQTDCFENITKRGLELKIARMEKKGFTWTIIKMALILLLMLPLTLPAQTWDQYKKRTEISVGALNLAFIAYSTGKQYFLPIQTQKWLNWCVAVPTIGFTIYTGIEYKKKFNAKLLQDSKLNCSFDSCDFSTSPTVMKSELQGLRSKERSCGLAVKTQ